MALALALSFIGAVRDSGSAMPPKDITAEQMVSRLLYRDGLILVVDKPAGIAVHRGPKGGDPFPSKGG